MICSRRKGEGLDRGDRGLGGTGGLGGQGDSLCWEALVLWITLSNKAEA